MSNGPTTKYNHAEAFCLMEYVSDDGTEKEVIWNSRDGVTPFVITLKSGKTAHHHDWSKDRCVPDFKPPKGTRMFVDMTEERARERATKMAAHYWDDNVANAQDHFDSREQCINDLVQYNLEEARRGAPDIVEVT